MAVNKLGSFFFKDFRGTPGLGQKQIERIVQPGVDGEALRAHGERCEPFDVIGVIDFANPATAQVAFALYAGLVGADPLEFIWHDIAVDPLKACVLAVVLERLKAVSCIVGGLNVAAGLSGVVAEVRFTLILVTVPEAP